MTIHETFRIRRFYGSENVDSKNTMGKWGNDPLELEVCSGQIHMGFHGVKSMQP